MRIAIAGVDGSGKSTLAQSLGLPVAAFAQSLRERCVRDGLLSREEAYQKPTPDRVRRILRDSSQVYKSLYGQDVFVRDLERDHGDKTEVVIDDLRFLDEANWCQNRGYTLVFLDKVPTPECQNLPSFRDLIDIRRQADLILPERPCVSEAKNKILQNLRKMPRFVLLRAIEADRELAKALHLGVEEPCYLTESWDTAKRLFVQVSGSGLTQRDKIRYILGIDTSDQVFSLLGILLLSHRELDLAKLCLALCK